MDSPATNPAHVEACTSLRREAAAMDRITEQLAWTVLPDPEPRLTPSVLRAVADFLETLESE